MSLLRKEVKVKLSTVAAAVSLALLVGCANKGTIKNADLKPDSDVIKPKPVSTVFHRPEGTMIINYSSDGKSLEIISKGTAPIAGNNAYSIENAAQIATMRAKRNIAEFISTQINTTRSIKVLSSTVQKSLEDTTNGVGERQTTVVDDRDFDSNGDPVVGAPVVERNLGPVDSNGSNTNSEKIAQIVRENITTNAAALLRGVVITNETIDQAGRTIVVEIRASTQSIHAANELRKQMGNQ